MKLLGKQVYSLGKAIGETRKADDNIIGKYVGAKSNWFDVTKYGATGNGTTDDTTSIQLAIDAAQAWKDSKNAQAVVYFPAGTYMVAPPGSLRTTLYKKAAGTWGSALFTEATTDQTETGFFYDALNPVDEGSDGDYWLNYRNGEVYIKASGTWSKDGDLMDYGGALPISDANNIAGDFAIGGTGWCAGYTSLTTSTGYAIPDDAIGSDGDWGIMYALVHDNDGGSVFSVDDTYGDIHFIGEDKATTTLDFKCWGGEDPEDYTFVESSVDCTVDTGTDTFTSVAHGALDGDSCVVGGTRPSPLDGGYYFIVNKTTDTFQLSDSRGGSAIDLTTEGSSVTVTYQRVTSSRIPLIENGAGVGPSEYGVYKRGGMFIFPNPTQFFGNMVWENLTIAGNTTATGDSGFYDAIDTLDGWDTSNKVLLCGGGGSDIGSFTFRNCVLDGWRAEILYKGGTNDFTLTVEDCTLSESNGSAISVGAKLTVERCAFIDVINSTENYSYDGMHTVMKGCTITSPRDIAENGVVVISPGTDAYTLVDNCSITNCATTGVFLSEAAQNVTIQNSSIEGSLWGIRSFYINQYGGTITPNWDNLLVDNVTFTTGSGGMSYCISAGNNATFSMDNWVISNCQTVENPSSLNAFFQNNSTRTEPNADVTISNCEVGVNYNAAITTAMDMLEAAGTRVVPFYSANTYNKRYFDDPLGGGDWAGEADSGYPTGPILEFKRVLSGAEYTLDNTRFHEGESITLRHRNLQSRNENLTILQGAWNDFDSDYTLQPLYFVTLTISQGVFKVTNEGAL